MTAMFPASGVPASDALNSILDPATINCTELWYSTSRCQPRFDPAAANAMLAELINLINKGEVTYDCRYLEQVEHAVRYLIQRGLPCAAIGTGGPANYNMTLDPPATRYNNFMALIIVPEKTNISGGTTINAGRGAAYCLRNDGQHLKADDLHVGIPQLICFYNGYWYFVGMAKSQVPLVVTGGIDAWIRTDGNDITGDGTANSPDKAFRSIAGCWNAIGARYAASPLLTINMRLGIPGVYDSAYIGPFGGNVKLIGDPHNRTAYRIHTQSYGPGAGCLGIYGMNMTIDGVTFALTLPGAYSYGIGCLGVGNGGHVVLRSVQFELHCHNTQSAAANMIAIEDSSSVYPMNEGNEITFEGYGYSISNAICCWNGSFGHGSVNQPGYINFRNYNFTSAALVVTNNQVCSFLDEIVANVNCHGPRYIVSANGLLYQNGQSMPGDLPGSVTTQGQVF